MSLAARWILAIFLAAPILLFLSTLLASFRAVSTFTASSTATFCMAAMSVCSGIMMLSRNPFPSSVGDIR